MSGVSLIIDVHRHGNVWTPSMAPSRSGPAPSIAGLRDGLGRAAAAARLDDARAARARGLVSERFTLTVMADELVSLYEDVASGEPVAA